MDKGFTNDAIPALGACESPIESKFVQAMFDFFRVEEYAVRYSQPADSSTRLIVHFTRQGWQPEYMLGIQSTQSWGRVDFVFVAQVPKVPTFERIVVELDGSRFHSSVDQQAKDRAKDRKAAQNGCVVIRFSGSEVYRNPHGVVAESLQILNARLDLKLEELSESYWRGRDSGNISEAAE